MTAHFYTLTVKQIKKETPDCVSVLLDVPDNLKKIFSFQAGQHVTLKKIVNNEELRRTYSICSAPFENKLKLAIKKVSHGKFSSYANNILQVGTEFEVLPPGGKFNPLPISSTPKNYVAFAAGSGITPIISIIKTVLYTEAQSQFTLVFGNRNRSSIIFFEELEGLKNKYLHRFNFINILSKEKTETTLNYGRINEEKLVNLNPIINYANVDAYFICGPSVLIFGVKDFLETRGIEKSKIHFELFGTPETKQQIANNTGLQNTGISSTSNVTIKVDGRSFDFALGFDERTILDAALQNGADLPFACKGGVCCTCKAKILEGKIKMNVHWGLEQEEIDNGFILTCQSQPLSQKVVIDFDIK